MQVKYTITRDTVKSDTNHIGVNRLAELATYIKK